MSSYIDLNVNVHFNINTFLKSKFTQLSLNNICDDNDFATYENFKKFIVDHYQLSHMEKYNYIKYVKVKRQILRLDANEEYNSILNQINYILKIMYDNHTFPNLDIKKYLFKINNIFKLIDDRHNSLLTTIKTIRTIFDLKYANSKVKMKILYGVNTLTYRYTMFLKYSKKLSYWVQKLIDFEFKYGIDHKLIELNNLERSYLGKKSEYTANKVIIEFTNYFNNNLSKITNKKYFYETNIDFLKLLGIASNHTDCIKGEIDGILIYLENGQYYIDKIIEVKSSIKSTFEDIKKFEFLQKHINNIDEINVKLNDNIILTKNSFKYIIGKELTNWIIYLCINNINQDFIEKSHLYFSTCLKIIDDDFIKEFYLDNTENVLKYKYNIINSNRVLIDNIFNDWINNIQLYNDNCNIFISKKDT